MELEDSYDNLADVPAEHAALYVEKEGKAVLQLTGLKTQDDFTRYGDALKKRYAETAAKTAANNADVDLDPQGIKRIVSDALKDLGLGSKEDKTTGNDTGEVHDLRRELASLKTQLEDANKVSTTATAEAQATKIKTSLQGEAAKTGMLPAAIDAFVSLISDSFEVSADGKVVVKLEGNQIASVSPNANPADVVAILKRDPSYSYFWPKSKTAGGESGGGGGGGDSANPWSADGWNMTRQTAMTLNNRAEAENMAKQAGSFIGATQPAK